MKSRISSISNTINEVVSSRPDADPVPEVKGGEGRDGYSRDGDALVLSELARKLHQLMEILEEEGLSAENEGFHFIMEKFLENPEVYEVRNFVYTLIEVREMESECFREILRQARHLQAEEHNPNLWLGILTRLSPREVVSFNRVTAEIFTRRNREDFVSELVAFLEEVRKILNEFQHDGVEKRCEKIEQAQISTG